MNRGILYILISTLVFAAVTALVKLMERIPVSEIVFFRSAITLTLSVYLVKKNNLPLLGNNHYWLLVRGIFGAAGLILFFITLKTLPIATATTVQYLSQIFTVIIAIYLVKEFVRPIRWIFFTLAFCGVLIMEGFREEPDWFFLLIGIASAFFSGIAYNAIIKCKDTDHPYTIVMAFPLIATPITGIWAAIEWVSPEGIEWIYLLLIGVFTQVAQVFMTMALHAEKAAIVTPFKYFGAVYALLTGYFIFGETLSLQSILGMALVILSVLINSVIK